MCDAERLEGKERKIDGTFYKTETRDAEEFKTLLLP